MNIIMTFDTAALVCIMTSIVGNTGAKTCATRVVRNRPGERYKRTCKLQSSRRPPGRNRTTQARIQPTTFDHFVKRWSSYSDEKHTAVDPARDAELMTRHTGEAPRIDDRSRSNRSVDTTASQNGFSDPAMLQLRRRARGLTTNLSYRVSPRIWSERPIGRAPDCKSEIGWFRAGSTPAHSTRRRGTE